MGTLYQYYPNKQALLFAILEKHLSAVADAVEAACRGARGKPACVIIARTIEAFLEAKMARAEISIALYKIASEIEGPAVARETFRRSARALVDALNTAPDLARTRRDKFTIQMLFGAMAGTTKSVVEAGAPPAMVGKLRRHLVLLAEAYLSAAWSGAATTRQR